jgi:hypothetical protein
MHSRCAEFVRAIEATAVSYYWPLGERGKAAPCYENGSWVASLDGTPEVFSAYYSPTASNWINTPLEDILLRT